mgnify:CR=1 FL=1
MSKFQAKVLEINALEAEIKSLSDEAIKERSLVLRDKIRQNGLSLDDAAVEAFALAREASVRTLNKRPYDVQMLGGLILHRGAITEMSTGEGKTLAAVAPAYLNALSGNGAHVVTVNEYLARRDAVWMGQIYRFLGLSVSCLTPFNAYMYDPDWKVPEDAQALADESRDETGSFKVQQDYLKPISRREAYLADITYGTNHEFGFDYLRDNLAYSMEGQSQRPLSFAIVDEVDSILIDEARTPLIISAPDTQSSELYKAFARITSRMSAPEDYELDEKRRSVIPKDSAIEKVQRELNIANLYAPENIRLVHYFEEALKAHAVFKKDKDYVVKDGQIFIVDEFTGRVLQGRRYNGGLHQAIEAKEGVSVKDESRTYGKISIQNYFRMYKKISGMTGTAQTSAEEFHKVYGLEVFTVPTNKLCARKDNEDLIYKDFDAKMKAIMKDVESRRKKGQPVLIGTTSIAKNEMVSAYLSKNGIPHELLNAKNNEREGSIIAQAGKPGSVTVATNMAGRGVDIILGGNPPTPEDSKKVLQAGGLYVVGTERHDARRIDNQLRGRSGRQGDPGESQFYLCLDDDLVRIFGGDKIRGLMERFNLPEDEPISMSFVSRAIAEAQSKVEGANFDARKHMLEYDDVLDKQRNAVYLRRGQIISAVSREQVEELVFSSVFSFVGDVRVSLLNAPALEGEELSASDKLKEMLVSFGIALDKADVENLKIEDEAKIEELVWAASKRVSQDGATPTRLISMLDMLWMNHLEDLEGLHDSTNLRAYGQRDPLVEYRKEANRLYQDLWRHFNEWVSANIFRMAQVVQNENGTSKNNQETSVAVAPQNTDPKYQGVGRNDPCPCGSGKKFKKCHGV